MPRLGVVAAGILLGIAVGCVVTLPWSLRAFDRQFLTQERVYAAPTWDEPMGADGLGRSLMARCALGGVISLGIGLSASLIAVGIGVAYGSLAAMAGGRVDAWMMRLVDVLYGLPYVLLVVMIDLSLTPVMRGALSWAVAGDAAEGLADVATLLLAIGSVSWLTMARVVRGQVLSLRSQPFIEAARATGIGLGRILLRHLLPNLVSVVVVYAALAVPQAILQESLLSFLGIGVQAPLPSWGKLAAEGIEGFGGFSAGSPGRWWLLLWPCVLLAVTLLSLNLMGDALRRRLDRAAAS